MESKNAYEFLKNEINKAIPGKFKTVLELANTSGVHQGNLNSFLNGTRKGLNFETAYKILQTLDVPMGEQKVKTSAIRRLNANSPVEKINENDNLVYVPICSYAGCGGEVDYNNVPENELVPVLKSYWQQNLRIIKVIGDSMEPTIKENSLVGVVPCTGNLKAGKVYLVNVPNFGFVIKRVYPGKKQGTILLSSDNKHHADRIIDCNGFDNVIVAEIIWVLQNM